MQNSESELLKTWDYPLAGTDPSELYFEKGKVIGTPVRVMRTGQAEPDAGWYIAEIHHKSSGKNRTQTFVKVQKPSGADNSRGLQKILPLQSLETLNPEIKLLLYESEKDYVLYEDKEHGFKIGLIIDIDLQEDTLLIMLGPEGEDITAPLDRIKAADVIDKNTDPRKLEETFHAEVKKRRAAARDPQTRQSQRRVGGKKESDLLLESHRYNIKPADRSCCRYFNPWIHADGQRPYRSQHAFSIDTASTRRDEGALAFRLFAYQPLVPAG